LIQDKSIVEVGELVLTDLVPFLQGFLNSCPPSLSPLALPIIQAMTARLEFLIQIGVGYLSTNRPALTLSAGELQRMRLATQIGSNLIGITYVLDEPSIGLHQSDNQQLIAALRKLTQNRNTVIVVEHDEDTILAADYVLDMGPFAGRLGGEIIAQGTPQELLKSSGLTQAYLVGKKTINPPKGEVRAPQKGPFLTLQNVSTHNLQNISVQFPLGCLICVTGVSGAGKSSLIMDTLIPELKKIIQNPTKGPSDQKTNKNLLSISQTFLTEKSLKVTASQVAKIISHIDRIIQIDQSPVGSTSRSNTATYLGVFDPIRKLFASLPESNLRGYLPGRFSFNRKTGVCPQCEGLGVEVVSLKFLADSERVCTVCNGLRYNAQTLQILYHGKNIKQILDMTIDEAIDFFDAQHGIKNILQAASEVGLGYLTLGQSLQSLSGGECQRLKISEQLCKKDTGKTLYVLDEPSMGLHFFDIELLLKSLEKLISRGNSIIIIEHNLDVIRQADWIIDLGPGAAHMGGQIVVQGDIKTIMLCKKSLTGQVLKNAPQRSSLAQAH
jgi:excinuclease ABC subunit A